MGSTAPGIASSLCTSASTTKPQNQNHYYNEYHGGLLEVENTFLKMLSRQMVDKTMVAAG
jgi:hypothetical protein